jgi:hypothetical protein
MQSAIIDTTLSKSYEFTTKNVLSQTKKEEIITTVKSTY